MSEAEDKYDALASAGERALEHFGVKGMHWGVRKNDSSGGGGSSSSEPKKKRTQEEQAIIDRRVKIGKDVAKAVVIAAGTVAISAVAGPMVGAGAGAVARTLSNDVFATTTTVTATTVRTR